MAKILVLFYSSYGHVEAMAKAMAEGAREGGAEVTLRRVPDLEPGAADRRARHGLDEAIPVAMIDELPGYDGIAIGTGTRFGRMSSPMAAFLEGAGGLWASDALVGKAGAAFTSTASQHGGQETTLFSIITNLLHFGMVVVGLPYSFKGQLGLGAVEGGSPYGATTIAAGDGSRPVSAIELDGARFQGRRLAEVAGRLA